MGVPKIMIPVQQTVEDRFLPCVPHLAKLQRPDRIQAGIEGRSIHKSGRRLSALSPPPAQRILCDISHPRQLNLSGAIELQHESAANYVAKRSVGLPPVPCFAQYLGQGPPARPRMFGNQRADERDIRPCHNTPAVPKNFFFHVRNISGSERGTQVLSESFLLAA